MFAFPALAVVLDMNLILVCLGIGLAIGLITVLIMRAQLRSVRNRNTAGEYVVPGSFQLTQRHDIFLYRTVRRVERPQNNQSR